MQYFQQCSRGRYRVVLTPCAMFHCRVLWSRGVFHMAERWALSVNGALQIKFRFPKSNKTSHGELVTPYYLTVLVNSFRCSACYVLFYSILFVWNRKILVALAARCLVTLDNCVNTKVMFVYHTICLHKAHHIPYRQGRALCHILCLIKFSESHVMNQEIHDLQLRGQTLHHEQNLYWIRLGVQPVTMAMYPSRERSIFMGQTTQVTSTYI